MVLHDSYQIVLPMYHNFLLFLLDIWITFVYCYAIKTTVMNILMYLFWLLMLIDFAKRPAVLPFSVSIPFCHGTCVPFCSNSELSHVTCLADRILATLMHASAWTLELSPLLSWELCHHINKPRLAFWIMRHMIQLLPSLLQPPDTLGHPATSTHQLNRDLSKPCWNQHSRPRQEETPSEP